ncbi:MAG: pilin [bacterium]|nr:pilin [bacterium]
MKYFLFIIIFFVGFSFALPGVVVGQDAGADAEAPQYTTDNPPPSITEGSPITGIQKETGEPANFIEVIRNIYTYAQWVAVALAAIMITLGGINIAVSGAVDRQAEGKDMIKSAIFGLVLLFGANLILRTINPALTNLTPPHLQSSVMAVRKCGDNDVTKDKSQLVSSDCALACDDSLDKGLSEEQKNLHGCVKFCGEKESPDTVDCIKELPDCAPGEQPKQFPPKCYVVNSGACNGPQASEAAKTQVEECFPRQVEIPPKSFDLLDKENYLTYADCMDVRIGFPDVQHPCEFKNLGKEGWFKGLLNLSSEAISGKEAKNGLVVWRYPFYRSSYEKPGGIFKSLEEAFKTVVSNPAIGAWPDQMQTGVETAQCIAYAYAPFDDNGMPQKWTRLPVPGNSYEDWKRCEIDFSDSKISQESSEQLGGLAVALPILMSSSPQEEPGGGPRAPVLAIGPLTLTHAQAYQQLLAAGINVWSSATGVNNCKTAPPCATSLEGIPRLVVSRLQEIKAGCDGCTVTINGATEPEGHSATTEHGPGRPVVDIEVTALGTDGRKLGKYLLKYWNDLRIIKVLMSEDLQKTFTELCGKTKNAGFSSCYDPGGNHFHVVFGL